MTESPIQHRYGYHGPLILTPWVRRYLSNAEAVQLAHRAKALGVTVSVDASSSRGPFRAEIIHEGPRFTWSQSEPVPYDAIEGVLDQWEAAHRYSDEEVLTIAHQSGVAVSRG